MSPAFGQRKYGYAGCGLGSLIFKPNGSQLSAGTSNNIGYQSVAITSGTSNCVSDDKETALLQQESFVVANYATLSKELAQGTGSSVVGLAAVLGCEQSSVQDFGQFAQEKYESIFLAPGSMAMLDKLKVEMAQAPSLTKSCKHSQIF